MHIIVIIVTYGDRFHLLNQVIEGVIEEQVSEIWVVDNGSLTSSSEQLQALAKKLGNLSIFHNDENIGTAGAYGEILKYAYQHHSDAFFWFLDDDNLPKPGSLDVLRQQYLALNANEETPVLYSYRGSSWKDDVLAVTEGLIKGPIPNSYCGFDFWSAVKAKLKKSNRFLAGKNVNYPLVKVTCGPYGGLFTHVTNLIKVGLPKKEMFVYADDHEFTLRFSNYQIPQYLVYHSQLIDLEMSIVEGGGYFSEKTSSMKLFYSLRNTIYLSKTLATNQGVYNFNRLMFFLIIFMDVLKNVFKRPQLVIQRLKLIRESISAGERGLLGNTFKF